MLKLLLVLTCFNSNLDGAIMEIGSPTPSGSIRYVKYIFDGHTDKVPLFERSFYDRVWTVSVPQHPKRPNARIETDRPVVSTEKEINKNLYHKKTFVRAPRESNYYR